MKKTIVAIIVIIAIVGAYFLVKNLTNTSTITNTNQPAVSGNTTATTTEVQNSGQTVIGKSVEGRDIIAYSFGAGDKKILFVGGIHGGYEWNTSKVAYQLVDYLKANPDAVPENIKVTVIPVLNPDGLYKIVGTTTDNFTSANVSSNTVPGRFNANNVDLNRNFDCDWQTTGTWQNKSVSGGSSAFSEPESLAVKY